jgi:hypothetical protein
MEMNMKKLVLLTALALSLTSFPGSAQTAKADFDPDGMVSYALPMTSLGFDVEAVQEKFYAGPYAKFARKYLGIEAREEDEQTYQLASVKITPSIEADQSSRYVVALSSKNGSATAFLQMTTQGLISVKDGSFGEAAVWRFPARTSGDFSDKGVGSNLTAEATTLYQGVKRESAYNQVAVQQNMVVEKSLEKKAQEAAEMIFNLRRTRVQIITGDTDANYSGEAMSSALAEIARLEKEYMTLFVGYSEFQTQRKHFDIVPVNNERMKVQVVFRLSDEEGLLPADNLSGKPYFIDITPEGIAAGEGVRPSKGTAALVYRIPAICQLTLSDGSDILLQSRLPIYQFGVDKTFPIK